MKITNFRLVERTGDNILNRKYKAIVTVETGVIFKNKSDKKIYKTDLTRWMFQDTGLYTPINSVDRLVRVQEGEKMQDLKDFII